MTARSDRPAYDRARYLALQGREKHDTCRKQDPRSLQRDDESDADYLKRIHQTARNLFKTDPDECKRRYPTWVPKQTRAERRAKKDADTAERRAKQDADTSAALRRSWQEARVEGGVDGECAWFEPLGAHD